jgi:hypothetical protein
MKDTVAPVVSAPEDVTVTAQGMNTPVFTDSGSASATDNFDGDLAVENDIDELGFGINPACDDGTNDGHILDCFPPGETVITYSATDSSGNTGTATQTITVEGTPLVMGWHDTDVNGFFPNDGIDYYTHIGSTNEASERIWIEDYRGNNDARYKDQITIYADNDGDVISVNLKELDINSGIFSTTDELLTFHYDATNDLDNKLQVLPGDNVFVSYDPQIDDPIQLNNAQIQTLIENDNAEGASITVQERIITDKEGYRIGEYMEVSIYDPQQENNGIINNPAAGPDTAEYVVKGYIVAGLRATSLAHEQNGACGTGNGKDTTINFALREIADTGRFVTTINVGVQNECSNTAFKILGARVGEPITLGYYLNNPGLLRVPELEVDIVPYSANDYSYDTVNAQMGLVLSSTPDTDGDGIADDWEDQSKHSGLRIVHEDFDTGEILAVWHEPCGAGTTMPVCPDPLVKDIFVELDYMQFHELDSRAIDDVVQMFADSPLCNPGGVNGCTSTGAVLHVNVDDEMPHDQSQDWNEFYTGKGQFFGTSSERDGTCSGCSGTGEEILPLKAIVYHYGQSIHDQLLFPGSSGDAEVDGNDFRISLGSFAGGTGTLEEQAGTLAHELGHNFGLEHGGGGPVNCKPNYLTVMNYAFQFPDVVDRPLDYSRFSLNSLTTTDLDEVAGIGPATHPTFGTWTTVIGINGVATPVTTGGNIDFDGDGDLGTDSHASATIHNMDIAGCESNTDTTLTTQNDWDALTFDLQGSAGYGDGAVINRDGSIAGRTFSEPTAETFEGFLIVQILPLKEAWEATKASSIPGTCTQDDIDLLDGYPTSGFDAIIETLGNNQPRSTQIKIAAQMFAEIKSSGALLNCLDPQTQLTFESFNEHLTEISTSTPRYEILADSIDIGNRGVVTAMIFGTGISGGTDFDVTTIDFDSIVLSRADQVQSPPLENPDGAYIARDPTNRDKLLAHFEDSDGDGNPDLLVAFHQRDIGLKLSDNDTGESGGTQPVCIQGVTVTGTPGVDEVRLPFNKCVDKIVTQESGPKNGGGNPNK